MSNQSISDLRRASELNRYRINYIKHMDVVRKNDHLLTDEEFVNMVRNQFYMWLVFERKHFPEHLQKCFNQLCEIDIYE